MTPDDLIKMGVRTDRAKAFADALLLCVACINWIKELVFRPSKFYSETNSSRIQAAKFGRICKTHFIAQIFDKYITAPISALLCINGPFAVSWLISSVVIYSLNGVKRCWFFPHIFKEISKFVPSLANSNSSCSVIQVCRVRWTVAPASHPHPAAQFVANFSSGSVPMFGLCPGNSRKPQTPATPLSAISEFFGSGLRLFAAIAQASPLHKFPSIFRLAQNREFPESQIRKVNKFRHTELYTAKLTLGADSL